MSGFLSRAILPALFLLLFSGGAGALAQEAGNDDDGLLAAPETSPPPFPAEAELNVEPMQLEEDPPAPVGPLDNLNIQGTPEQDEMWWMDGVLAKLSPAIQDELAKRSGKAQLYCEENFMLNNFYDCECYAIAVLKDLVLNAGETENIAPNIEDERFSGCVDTGKIAGFSYGRCQESLMMLEISDKMLEDTCQCAARAMAREYARTPIANMDRADRIYNGLVLDCRQRAAAGASSDITGGTPQQ